MKHEEPDDLWQLLGKAKEPSVSPFFARNVLRELRVEQQEQPGLFGWLRRHWQLAAFGACGIAVFAFGVVRQVEPVADPVALLAYQVSVSPDYQVINDLDELLASEENSVWLEPAVY